MKNKHLGHDLVANNVLLLPQMTFLEYPQDIPRNP